MKNDIYWVWLQNTMGIGASVIDIVEYFSSAENVFNAELSKIRECGLFDPGQIEKISEHSLTQAEKIISDCEKNNWVIVNPEDSEYPVHLKQISTLPLALYVWGDEKILSHKMPIGVVGTRNPSKYGMDVAHTLTRGLAEGGALVVSGGAQGIDSVAHTTAMENGGKTVVILGCGLGYPYHMDNFSVREKASMNGAVISEFPPFTRASQYSFIQRNRITAGMCRGVLVVEAGAKSGSLNTARSTVKFGRDLFVVTGDAMGTGFLGAHELVKKGAKVIFSAEDILSLYGYEIKNRDSFSFGSYGGGVFEGIDEFPLGKKEVKAKKEKKKSEKPKQKPAAKETVQVDITAMSENQRKIYLTLKDGITRLDDIAFTTKIQIRDVLIALTELEIDGIVSCGAGNEYILN